MQCVSRDNIRLSAARCAGLSSAARGATSGERRDTSDPQIIGIAFETRTGKDFRYVIGAAKDHRCLTSHEVFDYVGDRTITVVNIRWHQPGFLQPQQEV